MAREADELAGQADRLRALRKLAGVSQVTAANQIGVTPRAYQDWEAGRGDMSPDNRKAAARYFGTTARYIEDGETARRSTPDIAPVSLADLKTQLDRIEKLLLKLTKPEPVSGVEEPRGVLGLDATGDQPTRQDTARSQRRRAAGKRPNAAA